MSTERSKHYGFVKLWQPLLRSVLWLLSPLMWWKEGCYSFSRDVRLVCQNEPSIAHAVVEDVKLLRDQLKEWWVAQGFVDRYIEKAAWVGADAVALRDEIKLLQDYHKSNSVRIVPETTKIIKENQ